MPDKWYETSARSSCDGVSLRWVAGAVDDTLIHVLSGAIEVTALKYGHVSESRDLAKVSGKAHVLGQLQRKLKAVKPFDDHDPNNQLCYTGGHHANECEAREFEL